MSLVSLVLVSPATTNPERPSSDSKCEVYGPDLQEDRFRTFHPVDRCYEEERFAA